MTVKTCSFIINNVVLYCMNTIQSCDGERSPVSAQLGTDRQLFGNLLVTVYWVYVYNSRMFYDCLETTQLPIDNQSATKNCAGIVCNHYDWSPTSRQPVAHQSPTYLRPPKTFLRSIWSQMGFYLQQAKPPCDQLSLQLFFNLCNLSATSQHHLATPSVTSQWLPEMMVARRSPTGALGTWWMSFIDFKSCNFEFQNHNFVTFTVNIRTSKQLKFKLIFSNYQVFGI